MSVLNKTQCVPVDDKFGYVVIRQDLSLAFQASLESFYLFARKDGPVAGRITSQSKTQDQLRTLQRPQPWNSRIRQHQKLSRCCRSALGEVQHDSVGHTS